MHNVVFCLMILQTDAESHQTHLLVGCLLLLWEVYFGDQIHFQMKDVKAAVH